MHGGHSLSSRPSILHMHCLPGVQHSRQPRGLLRHTCTPLRGCTLVSLYAYFRSPSRPTPVSTRPSYLRRGQAAQARRRAGQETEPDAISVKELQQLGIANYSYGDLKTRLREYGLPTGGKKEHLRQRLAREMRAREQRERGQQIATAGASKPAGTRPSSTGSIMEGTEISGPLPPPPPPPQQQQQLGAPLDQLSAGVEAAYRRWKRLTDIQNTALEKQPEPDMAEFDRLLKAVDLAHQQLEWERAWLVAQQQQQQTAHTLGMNSDEWVKRLHSSHLDPQLIRLPASAQELQLFLEQPLPEPLPCSCEVLGEIPQNVLMQRGFGMQAGFGRFARHVAYVMTKKFPPGAQEIVVSAYYQAVFDEGLECINSSFSLPLIEDLYYDRNCADSFTATQPLKRPDYCLWSGFALLVKGEDKPAGHRILEPAKELSDKAEGGPWNKLVFGGLPFLICYAAAGARIQFYMMHRDTNLVEPISRTLDTHTMQDRAVLLSILLHLVALLARVVAVLPESPRLALAREIKHQGSTITTFESYIKKNVKLEFAANTNKSLETLQQVYIAVAEVDGVVHAKEPPTLREDGSYEVLLEPLAYDQSPRSEDELRSAIKTVLQALTELHGQGFVHRDIRWSNILFTGQGWLLTDLEGADRADQVPEVSFRCWGNHTLQDGKYTRASDMELVGKLLNIMPRMSENAQDLQQKLTCHDPQQRLSAQEALAHPWFS